MLDQVQDATPAIDLVPVAPNSEGLNRIALLTTARGLLAEHFAYGSWCVMNMQGVRTFCAEGAVYEACFAARGLNIIPNQHPHETYNPEAPAYAAIYSDANDLIDRLDKASRAVVGFLAIMGVNDGCGQERTLEVFDGVIADLKAEL